MLLLAVIATNLNCCCKYLTLQSAIKQLEIVAAAIDVGLHFAAKTFTAAATKNKQTNKNEERSIAEVRSTLLRQKNPSAFCSDKYLQFCSSAGEKILDI